MENFHYRANALLIVSADKSNWDSTGWDDAFLSALANRKTTYLLEQWELQPVDYCESTMDVAKERFSRSEMPLLVVARSQTGGRGRNGRKWHSPKDAGIYASFCWRAENGALKNGLAGLSLAVGVAIKEALDEFGVNAKLKWPNDVLYQIEGGSVFKKFAGVLVDSTHTADRGISIVVGIGLNLKPSSHSEKLSATDLSSIIKSEANYYEVLASLLEQITKLKTEFGQLGFAGYRTRWLSSAAYLGAEFSLDEEGVSHVMTGISEDGAIILRNTQTDEIRNEYSAELETLT